MEEEKQRKKTSKKYIVILFLLVLLVGGGCGIYYFDTLYGEGKIDAAISAFRDAMAQKLQKEETEQTDGAIEEGNEKNSISFSGGASFATKGKRFLMCTKDGVKYMNGVNDQKWNDTFTMVLPELVEEGNFWAVGDLAGKGVKVYNEDGVVYSVQSSGNIVYFALNENGYLGIITKENEDYSIVVYNNTGTQLAGRQEGVTGVYPLSIDISDDNKVFAVSYLDTTDINPIGRISFFYISETEGKNFPESMFASVQKEDELIAKIAYMKNGTLAAISDLSIYGIDSDGKERWNMALPNHISRIGFEKKQYIVVAYGDAISGRESRKEGNVSWLNGDGKEVSSFQAKGEVTYLNCNSMGTVIGTNKTYYGLKTGGRAFWEYTATKDMTDVLLMDHVNHVLFVTNDMAVIVDMNQVTQDTTVKEEKEEVQSTEKVIEKQEEDTTQEEQQTEEQPAEGQQDNSTTEDAEQAGDTSQTETQETEQQTTTTQIPIDTTKVTTEGTETPQEQKTDG